MTHRPSDYLPPGVPAPVELPDVPPNPPGGDGAAAAGYDPLRLCIFATIAVLGWLFGPLLEA